MFNPQYNGLSIIHFIQLSPQISCLYKLIVAQVLVFHIEHFMCIQKDAIEEDEEKEEEEAEEEQAYVLVFHIKHFMCIQKDVIEEDEEE